MSEAFPCGLPSGTAGPEHGAAALPGRPSPRGGLAPAGRPPRPSSRSPHDPPVPATSGEISDSEENRRQAAEAAAAAQPPSQPAPNRGGPASRPRAATGGAAHACHSGTIVCFSSHQFALQYRIFPVQLIRFAL
ncbi:unnamed protein product [Coccothraustes coccothraustes]